MMTQQSPTLGRPPQAHGVYRGALVAGIGLVAILAVGLLVRQTGPGSEPAKPAGPAQVPAAKRAGRTAPARSALTVYLVATEEEAGRAAVLSEGVDPERRYGDVATVVAVTEDQARQMRAFIADLNRTRNAEGLTPVHVVDESTRTATPERVDGGRPAREGAGTPAGGLDDMPRITP